MKTTILLSCLAVIAVGCAHTETSYRRQPSEYMKDQLITARIKKELFKDPNVSGFDVDVATHRRLVQLNGFVDSDYQRARAEDIATGIQGVAAVQNNLLLKGGSPEARLGKLNLTPAPPSATPTGQNISRRSSKAYPTALALVENGNRFVSPYSQNKVVAIQSEKSQKTLHPENWSILYFDPTAAAKTAAVRLSAGKVGEVDRNLTLQRPSAANPTVLDLDRVRFDSDDALNELLKDPAFQNVPVTASSMTLSEEPAGPVWHVRVWAKTPGQPQAEREVGQFDVSAETGEVLTHHYAITGVQ